MYCSTISSIYHDNSENARKQMAVATVVIFLIAAPLVAVVVVLVLVLWLASTLSLIGPMLAAFGNARDKETIARVTSPPTQGAPVELLTIGLGGRRLAVRWTPGAEGTALPPVAIPNGLGATIVSIGRLHDAIAARGFPVLSYDRAGVGMSDPLPAGTHHAGAADTVADLRAVLLAFHPGGDAGGWLMVGPSMGSIVVQAYLAAYGDDPLPAGIVNGFLNLDGFPFPFSAKRPRFERSALVYRGVASVIWTGILRCALLAAGGALKAIETTTFPLAVVRAQMNARNFYGSLAAEMYTMLDCADAALSGWGPAFDIAALDAATLSPLVAAAPAACGDVVSSLPDDGTGDKALAAGAASAAGWAELPRSAWERGAAWADASATAAAVERLLAADSASGAPSILPRVFRRLVVRCMSARSYDFPGGKSFYDDEMKDWAAAEHVVHAALAANGARTVFPTHTHGDLFFATIEYAAAQVEDMAAVVASRKLAT